MGMAFKDFSAQTIFKLSMAFLLCGFVALNFQNCSDSKDVADEAIDPLSLEAVVVKEKSGGAGVTVKNPVRVGKDYVLGLMSSNVHADVSLDASQVSSTTATCTLARLAGSQVVFEISCSSKGTLVLELVLHRLNSPDAIMSITLSVQDANSVSDLEEFQFTGPTGNLIAFEEYRLNYTYKNTSPFVMPRFTTMASSTVRCSTLSHPVGSLKFLCDRPGVWVVEGVQEGVSFAKVKSFNVIAPTQITPYFYAQVNSVGSLKKLSTLNSSIAKDASSLNSTIKLYSPSGVGSGVTFSVQPVSQTGTMCTTSGVPSGAYLKTLICSGTGQVVLSVTIQWSSGVQRTSQHTLKIQ